LLGMTFPVACRLYTKSDSLLGTEVSAVYAFNTAGGIVGSLITGFLLIPHLGAQMTLALASAISVGTGAVLALYDRESGTRRLRGPFLLLAAVIVLYIFFNPPWDPELMA